MIISLIGFMGSGKSSVGKLLACLYRDRPDNFCDLDIRIEEVAGKRIPDIFREEGEEGFRQRETACLEELFRQEEPRGGTFILSLGGGSPLRNSTLIRAHSRCVYLKASAETLAENLRCSATKRPLLATTEGQSQEERIAGLLAEREAIYEATAHCIIDTDGKTPAEVAEEIFYCI